MINPRPAWNTAEDQADAATLGVNTLICSPRIRTFSPVVFNLWRALSPILKMKVKGPKSGVRHHKLDFPVGIFVSTKELVATATPL